MTTDTLRAALLPCPFCGHEKPSFEQIGDFLQSCIVVCGNCGARHESSDEGDQCGRSWNERAALAAPVHASDCAMHNTPAYPNGPCDCGAAGAAPVQEPKVPGLSDADLKAIRDTADEYESLLERWELAHAGSQEVANLHATFKARAQDVGRLVEGGLFRRILVAIAARDAAKLKHHAGYVPGRLPKPVSKG